jgi:hypothetical protein
MIKNMNKESMLDGLVALFSQNSKKEITPEDQQVIDSIITKFDEEPVNEQPTEVVEEVKVSEEDNTVEAPENTESITEEEEQIEEILEESLENEVSNEIVETEETNQYISRKDFDDFKKELLSLLSKETETKVVEEPTEEQPIKKSVGLQKGDPARHNTSKSSIDTSKYMG